MIDLFTLEEAKQHVRVTANHADGDIQFKILQATAILLNYIKVPLDATADDSPTTLPWMHEDWMGGNPQTGEPPWDIKAAAILIFAELFAEREAGKSNPLSTSVCALLCRYRDPALA